MRTVRRSALGEVFGRMTPAVKWLIIVTTVIWIVELLRISALQPAWSVLMLRANDLFGRLWAWQLVTYQFLHDPVGLAHVLFNMLMLWMFGRELERMWGGPRFVAFYLGCGAAGGLLHATMTTALGRGGDVPVIGASGAVLGLFAAWAVYWPHRQILMFFVVPMEMRFAVLITAGIELLLAWNPAHGVANFAHLGGMAAGWLWLKHGWRLGRIGALPAALSGKLVSWRRARKRSRMKVIVREEEWDKWLSENDPDDRGTRH
jgi:membrane associated rhomboid family serine protease